ncbi:E3 ubiquitin-protein ligase ptr1 [Astathelohania contejeani]|uniref:HECT-type E3 ubiquitin transferase n=1 Tax=Astathelohania contejeani TaxID=164912 RepID=A0ABQ7HVQ4_9MICR|nr:E3 ubiquitin-protein ligase ptr1 [Thelohania contejeani]
MNLPFKNIYKYLFFQYIIISCNEELKEIEKVNNYINDLNYIDTLRSEMNNNNNIEMVIDNIEIHLESNLQHYLNDDKYNEYFADIIHFITKTVMKGNRYEKKISKLIKYTFMLLKTTSLKVIIQLSVFFDYFSRQKMYLNDSNWLPLGKYELNILNQITKLPYPYSYPLSMKMLPLSIKYKIRKEYKICDNLHDTLINAENRKKHFSRCSSDIIYIDHIRSIYYVQNSDGHFLLSLKFHLLYLKFSLTSNILPTKFFNITTNILDIENLLSDYKNVKLKAFDYGILWGLLYKIIACANNKSILLNDVQTLRRLGETDAIGSIIYDYFISSKAKNYDLQKKAINVFFMILQIKTKKFEVTADNYNILIESLDYICSAHNEKVYIKINELFKIKMGISFAEILIKYFHYIKRCNLYKLGYIFGFKRPKINHGITIVLENYTIRHFYLFLSTYKAFEINDMLYNIEKTRKFLILLLLAIKIRNQKSELITNFCKSLITSNMNICLSILYNTKQNTKIQETFFYLCMLFYECCYLESNNTEKSKFKHLFKVVICSNNPIINDILYEKQYYREIVERICEEDKNISSKVRAYFLKNKFEKNLLKEKYITFDSNNVLKRTKIEFNKLTFFRYIKWNITFSDIKGRFDYIYIWFNLYIKELIGHQLNLFEKFNTNHFYPSLRINSSDEILSYYNMTGMLMGIGLCNNNNFRLNLSPIVFKHILKISCNYSDFETEFSMLCNQIKDIGVSNLADKKYTINIWDGDILVDMELISNGKNILISETNSSLYLKTISKIFLKTGIEEQIAALVNGLSKIIYMDSLNGLNEIELKSLIYGFENYTSSEILSLIRFDDQITDYEKTYIKDFINECDNMDLNKIVRHIIGDESLSGDNHIRIVKSINSPISRGFSSRKLAIPNFKDYISFKNEMIYFINHSF